MHKKSNKIFKFEYHAKREILFFNFFNQLHEVDWNDNPNCKLSKESLNHFGKGFLKNFLASICKDRDLLID